MIEIIALKTFDRATKKLMEKEEIEDLGKALQENPEAGDVIRGTGGVRKLRWASEKNTKGKSGGLRIIYFFHDSKGKVFLITAYPKNKKDDLTKAQENELKKLTDILKGE